MHAPYFRADPVSDVPIEQGPDLRGGGADGVSRGPAGRARASRDMEESCSPPRPGAKAGGHVRKGLQAVYRRGLGRDTGRRPLPHGGIDDGLRCDRGWCRARGIDGGVRACPPRSQGRTIRAEGATPVQTGRRLIGLIYW